jgi:hypothetical protein
MNQLLNSVHPDQIAAATAIHDSYMSSWAAADKALDLLRVSVRGFTREEVLLKAAAVDRFYYSRHFRLTESVERIVTILADPPSDPVSVVEAIAPVAHGPCYWSFTSKFAHFFINPKQFPIYDDWAIRTVRHHFGGMRWTSGSPYRVFAEYVLGLREQCGLSCSLRELDRYLWLSGMLRGWRSNASVPISVEVRSVFESPDPDVQRLADQLA